MFIAAEVCAERADDGLPAQQAAQQDQTEGRAPGARPRNVQQADACLGQAGSYFGLGNWCINVVSIMFRKIFR